MSELFGVQIAAISKHLKNIFQEGELEEKVVVFILEITTQHDAIADKMQNKESKIKILPSTRPSFYTFYTALHKLQLFPGQDDILDQNLAP